MLLRVWGIAACARATLAKVASERGPTSEEAGELQVALSQPQPRL